MCIHVCEYGYTFGCGRRIISSVVLQKAIHIDFLLLGEVCVCVCVLPSVPLSICFETESLPFTKTYQSDYDSWPGDSRNPPVSASTVFLLQVHATMPDFLMWLLRVRPMSS